MELKITFKNGDKSQAVKLAGDPGDLIGGIVKGLTGAFERVQKLFEDIPSDD
jgi:hypothetical protein